MMLMMFGPNVGPPKLVADDDADAGATILLLKFQRKERADDAADAGAELFCRRHPCKATKR